MRKRKKYQSNLYHECPIHKSEFSVPHAANIEIVPSPIVHDQSTLHGTRQHVEALKHRTEPIVDSTEDNPLFKYDKVYYSFVQYKFKFKALILYLDYYTFLFLTKL